MLRVEVCTRALRASQNLKRAKVGAVKLRGEVQKNWCSALLLWSLAQFCLRGSRAEEAAQRRRAHSVDHAGLEDEEHRAWYVLAARGLVEKHVYAAELRVVFTGVLAVAADAVLVTQHLLKLASILLHK